ncbi:hypothetical protein SAMCFNEI73_pC0303 (plasmid) [Sinorhizobium americanum]|uniref:Uncharacterized protein n=1 Tax=Sinorhizobium americanum TaxID=194963 RepID=A0A1L3LVB0_9HYPH|nr:hypothetical protein SAMCFNEI73_pC0303 [Sinorhizobium americanum]
MSTMSRPAAFSSRARAAAAVLGDTLILDTRDAGTKVLIGISSILGGELAGSGF